MSLVRFLGFTTLTCGCVVGRYREVATSREVSYVEEKGRTAAAMRTGGTTRSGRRVRRRVAPLPSPKAS